LYGQGFNTVNFTNWQKKDGLPSNNVTSVVKDKLGFLWIATNDGLCRYDGPNLIKHLILKAIRGKHIDMTPKARKA